MYRTLKLVSIEKYLGGKELTPTTSVKIQIGEQIFCDSAIGNGPIDAGIKAINKIIQTHAPTIIIPTEEEIVSYNAHAIGHGGGATCGARFLVIQSEHKFSVTGDATDTDTIVASLKAYLDAVIQLNALTTAALIDKIF